MMLLRDGLAEGNISYSVITIVWLMGLGKEIVPFLVETPVAPTVG
jgi:hypothetical protein